MRLIRATLLLAVVLGLTSGARADEYTTQVVARNLQRPTGVAVSLNGQVYFTELPTPGVGGAAGGTNTVNILNPKNGKIRNLTTGEPEPTNLAVNICRDVYWTCKSAGVILSLEQGRGNPKLIASGLDKPTGIAAYPLGQGLLFTEVPTPAQSGANGGRNAVYSFFEGSGQEFLLDFGDPQPSDVAVDLFGNVYWTCTSAGVIVRRTGNTTTVIAQNLDKPYGLATDYRGNLFFTEVPTPGVSGANGGRNKVSMLKLSTGAITVINEGDPDPIDVSVAPFGTTVYWTCRSAGVIIEAKP
jgi:hypothetical protein